MKESLYKIITGSLIVGSSILPSRALGFTFEGSMYELQKSNDSEYVFSVIRDSPYNELWGIAQHYGVEGDSNLVKVVNGIVDAQDNKGHSKSFLRRINQDKYSVIDGRVVEKPDGIRGDIIWPDDIFRLNQSELESLAQYGFRVNSLEESLAETSLPFEQPIEEEKTSSRVPYLMTASIGISLALVAYAIRRMYKISKNE